MNRAVAVGALVLVVVLALAVVGNMAWGVGAQDIPAPNPAELQPPPPDPAWIQEQIKQMEEEPVVIAGPNTAGSIISAGGKEIQLPPHVYVEGFTIADFCAEGMTIEGCESKHELLPYYKLARLDDPGLPWMIDIMISQNTGEFFFDMHAPEHAREQMRQAYKQVIDQLPGGERSNTAAYTPEAIDLKYVEPYNRQEVRDYAEMIGISVIEHPDGPNAPVIPPDITPPIPVEPPVPTPSAPVLPTETK